MTTAFAVDRAARQLERLVDTTHRAPPTEREVDRALLIATLAAHPDRVARRRRPHSEELVFVGWRRWQARGATAWSSSPCSWSPSMPRARGAGGKRVVQVRSASAIESDWLLELFIDAIDERDELEWNPSAARVERVRRLLYRDLIVDEQRDPASASERLEEAAAVLAAQAVATGIERFVALDALETLRARMAFVAACRPDVGIEPPTDEALATLLANACLGLTSFAELANTSLLDAIASGLGSRARQLDELAPTHVSLPGRRRVPVHYHSDRPPWIESRLQDFFGLERGPTIAGGRTPLVLHLLAPNRRALQVTQDLSGFWQRHYPELRKQLMRRYPKHAWPERP